MTAFLNALAFLTRLVPARPCEATALAHCVPFFAPVGIILGLLCTAAAFLAQTFMSNLSAPSLVFALAALLWIGLEIWLTRGLHWDGLADIADAAGAPAPRFWEILKDSHLGVFGALSLLVTFCGQWTAIAWHVSGENWPGLILAPAWGRMCAVWLAASAHPYNPQSLGGLIKAGAGFGTAALPALGALLVLALFGLPWLRASVLLAVQYWLIRTLVKLAQKKGGFSGDFLGAAIVTGQSWFLLAIL